VARINFSLSSNQRLLIAFCAALLYLILLPQFFSALKLFYFTPFLIALFYKKTLNTALWAAALCGFIMDLLSSTSHLGIVSLNYVLTTLVLYPQKRHFFADSFSTLPIMTFLFSILSTLLQVILLFLLDTPLHLSFLWFEKDLIVYPLADALYALVGFTLLPIMPRRVEREYFFR
jgi:rod shape-determining protein MreD